MMVVGIPGRFYIWVSILCAMRLTRNQIRTKEAGQIAKKANLKASLVILVLLVGTAKASWLDQDKLLSGRGDIGDGVLLFNMRKVVVKRRKVALLSRL